MIFHAQTVEECWQIARRAAKAYQREANRHNRRPGKRVLCLAARNTADRIALEIRYGGKRGRK
jgi:hypothetical protein